MIDLTDLIDFDIFEGYFSSFGKAFMLFKVAKFVENMAQPLEEDSGR